MKVLLVGHDFDFSAGDGISRYSYELYNGLRKLADVRTIATGKTPRPVRAFFNIKARDADIVHLMYPDVANIDKGKAKMAIMWHDMRLFTKYDEERQARSKPKLSERFNVASSMIRRWALSNYSSSDANLCNSTQTLAELKAHVRSEKAYKRGKRYAVTPLGVNPEFLRNRVWNGDRKDFAYVGSIHLKHKNLTGLLEVFNRIAESSDSKLHIFTPSQGAAEQLGIAIRYFRRLSSRNVVLHRMSTTTEISGYLPQMAGYLQLTKHEGFGIPILEALASGTNVLTLKGSSIPDEVKKYTFAGTEAEVVKKALELAKDPTPAPPRAISYARSFTWERTVRETLRVYEKLLG